jgi:flavodoxin
MKTAVVYYSLDGNCACVAEELKRALKADLIRLFTTDEKKRVGIAKFFWGGKMIFLRKNPPLKPYTFNPAAYDLIVIGVPVWAGNPAAPIKTFASQTGITGKKIALFVCHASGKGEALEKLKTLFTGNTIISEIDFNKAVINLEEVKQQIADWVKGF